MALATIVAAVGLGLGSTAAAQDELSTESPADAETTADEPTAEEEAEAAQLREGAAVYTAICSSCHQPGGAGLAGQFPPLLDNPHVDDTAYVTEVINNGLSGPIEVNGETYDSVMPAFSTLSDAETAALIAYIQNDFSAPAEEAGPVGSTGPVAGAELPVLADLTQYLAYGLAVLLAGLVLAPRLTSRIDRLNTPWLDAWLKTATIVVGVILFTILIPDWILKTETVGKLSRPAQDFIGVTVWGAGIAAVIGSLWYAHRDSRI